MKLRFILPSVISFAQLTAGHALADDAYDDEEPIEQPTDSRSLDDGNEVTEADALQTGGLSAPDALAERGDQRTEIEKELAESDEKDSGRGLEFVWLGGEIGFQALNVSKMTDGGLLAPETNSNGAGLVYGGALGVRFLYFTLGARFRNARLGDFNHLTLVAEGALRVPLGKLEPYFLLGGGYAGFSGEGFESKTGGLDLRVGAGLDYYFSDTFSAGAALGGDLLILSNSLGSNTGGGLTGTLLLGFHF